MNKAGNKQSEKKLMFHIILLILILCFWLIFALAVKAYQNEKGIYLSIDNLELNQQDVIFDLDNVNSGLHSKNKTIFLNLKYGDDINYDKDNDGIEKINGVIDFVADAKFNWDVYEDKLCARWEIYSIEKNSLTAICYGSQKCCGFVSLDSTRENWSTPLYLTYGMHDASENNIISAQVIYVDYNLSRERPYSEIYYSRWSSLTARFEESIGSVKNISMEEALRSVDKIRRNNTQIKKIDLKDKYGNELRELSQGKNASMVFSVAHSKVNDNSTSRLSRQNVNNEIIVSLNDFNASNADWDSSKNIKIKTENIGLEDSLKQYGMDTKAIVSVQGVDDFISDKNYYGTVKFNISDVFNVVIYCPDDKIGSCRYAQECINGFKGVECYVKNLSSLIIYVPHFSSIILGLDNRTANLTIKSPENSSVLQSGENIYLNFTINETVNANYSLDAKPFINLGNEASFSGLLNGSINYGILENGAHNISINIRDIFGNKAIINYSFWVNDTAAPNVLLNITNNTAFSGTSGLISASFNSSEYSTLSYKINNNNFSNPIDLGANKYKIMNITFSGGVNNLTINASDFHNNGNLNYFSFNFTLFQQPSCSDALQNGDETGVDCGGGCGTCINFSVATDRESYNLTDNVFVTVIARANSTVNLTIIRQDLVAYRHTFIPVFSGAPVAETRIISNTSNAGNYTINATLYYLNITQYINRTFEILPPVASPIAVTIMPNATTIKEGNPVFFASSVSGNNSAVSYKWDFQNDGVIDSTSDSQVFTYASNGTYTVNLTVSDSKWNQTDLETIYVKKVYNVTVIVRDNSTSSAIQNAEIWLEDEIRNTTGSGTADYSNIAGFYRLMVKKPGYAQFSNKTEINGNSLLEVVLIEDDNLPPIIQLISPTDKSTISNGIISFVYRALDKSLLSCTLYTKMNSSEWKISGVDSNLQSNAENSFTISGLKNTTYEWKIGCIDAGSNSNYSEIYSFTVDASLIENQLSIDLNEEDKNSEDILSQISEIMSEIGSLNAENKEAAEALQLKNNLDKAVIAVQRANRDLHSLQWRKLNDTELEEETKNILNRIKILKDTTPKTIKVIDKNEFVKYPNKEDINNALQILANSTNAKLSKNNLNDLVQQNFKLQSLISVTTKAKIIDVEYISGNKNTITLIQKIVNFDKDFKDLVYFEVIPKGIAKNLTELKLLFDYEVVDNDPVIKIDLSKIKDYSFYVEKKVSLESTEEIKSVLLSKNLKSESGNLLTGFSVFDQIPGNLVKTLNARLIIEFAVMIILLLVFLHYQFGSSGKFKYAFNGKELNETKQLIDSALVEVNNNNYEKSSLIYKEVNIKFNNLDKKKKDMIKDSVIELINRINRLYINQLAEKANNCIKANNKQAAFAIYSQIQSLYRVIPKNYKAEVSKKCLELYSAMNSN
ncbi:MAG: PKD domain-containing protein [Nanoarchaeota archaeon]